MSWKRLPSSGQSRIRNAGGDVTVRFPAAGGIRLSARSGYRRIESDIASAFDSDKALFGTIALRERMNDFERGNRVPVLFSSCMSSKGYNRR